MTLKCIILTVRSTAEYQGSENGSDAPDKQTVHWEFSWEFIRRQNVVLFMVSDEGRKVSQKEPASRLSLISSQLNKGRGFQLKNIPVRMWGNCGKRPQLIKMYPSYDWRPESLPVAIWSPEVAIYRFRWGFGGVCITLCCSKNPRIEMMELESCRRV